MTSQKKQNRINNRRYILGLRFPDGTERFPKYNTRVVYPFNEDFNWTDNPQPLNWREICHWRVNVQKLIRKKYIRGVRPYIFLQKVNGGTKTEAT